VTVVEWLTYLVPTGFVCCMAYVAFHRVMRR
jgi:hypothetical protein